MFQSVQQRGQGPGVVMSVDIAPLIDVVFILLIFFLVTATFVRDTGVTVDRPRASRVEALESESLRLSITAGGAVYSGGERMSDADLRRRVRAFTGRSERGSVIVIPDQAVPAGRLVQVMDLARQSGARRVAVASRRPSGQ